jgi:hypothetical protein
MENFIHWKNIKLSIVDDNLSTMSTIWTFIDLSE